MTTLLPAGSGHPAPDHPATTHATASGRTQQGGMALVVALFFAIVVVGLTTTGAMVLRSHQTTTRTRFATDGQAVQFARSGLTEALGWLRKQTAQPVTEFAPQLDTGATPPRLDTQEPEIGIVREFPITESIWGRYEVWKRWDADPDAERREFRQQVQCEDISAARGGLSPGSVWRLRSVGYVFRRVNPAVRFDTAPNRVLARDFTEVEARRLALQPPGQAALSCRNGSSVVVGTRGRVLGGALGAGLYCLAGTGAPSVSGTGATLTGTPGSAGAAAYDDSFAAVFGVSREELQAMADAVVGGIDTFPSPVARDSLVVCTGPVAFSAAKPLAGTGVVAVFGNTTISPGSYSGFSGLLYVQGNLVLREPCELQGAVVVTGSVSVQGSSDWSTVTYDDGILGHLRQELGTYRLSSAVARPFGEDR